MTAWPDAFIAALNCLLSDLVTAWPDAFIAALAKRLSVVTNGVGQVWLTASNIFRQIC